MKDERNVRRRRTAGGRWRPAAILLAAVIAAVSVPFFGKSVFAADPEPSSLTVFTNQDMSDEDKKFLDEANVVLDIYRIADVTRDEVYDTFNWAPVTILAEAGLTLPDDTYSSIAEQTLLQVMSRTATKWNGIQKMLEAYGISASRAVLSFISGRFFRYCSYSLRTRCRPSRFSQGTGRTGLENVFCIFSRIERDFSSQFKVLSASST